MVHNFAPLSLATLGALVGLSGYQLDIRQMWIVVSFLLAAAGFVIGKYIRKLSISSYTDFLTGLWNRRYFYKRLGEEEICAGKRKTRLCVAMIDVDRFKAVNDTYGHLAGDALLKDLAALLKKNTRRTDIVTRWGGDEFAIIFAAASLDQAQEIMERIRHKIEETYHASYGLTISAGIIELEPDLDLKHLLIRADQALYEAKAQKNTVIAAAWRGGQNFGRARQQTDRAASGQN